MSDKLVTSEARIEELMQGITADTEPENRKSVKITMTQPKYIRDNAVKYAEAKGYKGVSDLFRVLFVEQLERENNGKN